jgi:hypothetical protein
VGPLLAVKTLNPPIDAATRYYDCYFPEIVKCIYGRKWPAGGLSAKKEHNRVESKSVMIFTFPGCGSTGNFFAACPTDYRAWGVKIAV